MKRFKKEEENTDFNTKKRGGNNNLEYLSLFLSIVAIIVAAAAIYFGPYIQSDLEHKIPGTVTVENPWGYEIIKGYDQGSDVLVLPLFFSNTGGLPELLSSVSLKLTVIKNNQTHPKNIGDSYIFTTSGTFDTMGFSGVREGLTPQKFIPIDSYGYKNMLIAFHPENWWDEKNKHDYGFQFYADEHYQMDIFYFQEAKNEPESKSLGILKIYGNVAKLANYTYDNWNSVDYFDLDYNNNQKNLIF